MVVVLKHLGAPLFNTTMFHSWWKRVSKVELDTSLTSYAPTLLLGATPNGSTVQIDEDADKLHYFLPEEHAGQSLGVNVPDTPSKNPLAHGQYQSRPVKDKPSDVNLMKRCEEKTNAPVLLEMS